jgi:hypothetical protein
MAAARNLGPMRLHSLSSGLWMVGPVVRWRARRRRSFFAVGAVRAHVMPGRPVAGACSGCRCEGNGAARVWRVECNTPATAGMSGQRSRLACL